MRFAWTFFAGLTFAGLTLLVSAPLMGGVALVAVLLRGDMWTMLSGESYFAVRDEAGRTAGQMVNVNFRTVMVPTPDQPRPRRLLLRLEIRNPDVFTDGRDGRVRLDSWLLDEASDLRRQALYTVIAPGTVALIEDGVLQVENGKSHSYYALTSGAWLFDADTPVTRFTLDTQRHRFAAIATADEGLPAGSVAVISYAAPEGAIRRLMLGADDPTRARILRTAMALTRPVTRIDERGTRLIEVPMPAGTLKLPLAGDDIALDRAEVPAGLTLSEIKPWR